MGACEVFVVELDRIKMWLDTTIMLWMEYAPVIGELSEAEPEVVAEEPAHPGIPPVMADAQVLRYPVSNHLPYVRERHKDVHAPIYLVSHCFGQVWIGRVELIAVAGGAGDGQLLKLLFHFQDWFRHHDVRVENGDVSLVTLRCQAGDVFNRRPIYCVKKCSCASRRQFRFALANDVNVLEQVPRLRGPYLVGLILIGLVERPGGCNGNQ